MMAWHSEVHEAIGKLCTLLAERFSLVKPCLSRKDSLSIAEDVRDIFDHE